MGSSSRIKAGIFLISLLWQTTVRGQTTATPQTDVMSDSMATGETSPTASSIQTTADTGPTSSSISISPGISMSTNPVSITGMSALPSSSMVVTATSGSSNISSDVPSCWILSCNSTACYNTFLNTNATLCSSTDRYCELRKDDSMLYSVRCAATCSALCNSTTNQTNCTVACCSSGNCLNSTLASLSSMSMTTTTTATTTTTKATTGATTTPANNGKKCQKVSCNGDLCYQGNTNVVLCAPTQNFCMLKKTTSGTTVTWSAGCSEDCSKETVCTSATSNCFLECCNATTASSCLKLTGQVNMPSSAVRGLYSPLLLIASSLLLWLLSIVTSA